MANPSGELPVTFAQESSPEVSLPQIEGYELVRELGRGRFGVVYLAWKKENERQVALKLLATEPVEWDHFGLEAAEIARLNHPNIVPILEIGEHAGRPFVVYEFCPGGSLADKLNSTPLPASQAAWLLEMMTLGVQFAHENGVVHGDLKPANVLLAASADQWADVVAHGSKDPAALPADLPDSHWLRTSVTKVGDFGLTQILAHHISEDAALGGTPSYVAPEQMRGKGTQVGPTADIYALGVILYEVLTGRPPFRAASPSDTRRLVLEQDPVSPSEFLGRMPADLETICLTCLHKDPNRRYQVARHLARDLRRFQEGKPIGAQPPGKWQRAWRWSKRNPVKAVLLPLIFLALLAGAGLSAWLALMANDQAAEQREITRKAQEAERGALADAEASGRLARHRLYAAQMHLAEKAWERGHVRRLRELLDEQSPEKTGGTDLRGFEWHYWKRLSDPTLLTFMGHHHVVQALAFSPDGKQVASASWDGTVKVWGAATGAVAVEFLGHQEGVRGVAYSPNGLRLFSVGDTTLRFWDARTGQLQRLLQAHAGGVDCLALSADGKRVVTGGQMLQVGPEALGQRAPEAKVWDAENGQVVWSLTGPTQPIVGVAISPDRGRVAAASLDGSIWLWDAATGKRLHVLLGQAGVVRAVAFSPNGQQIASGHGDGTIKVWETATARKLQTLAGHTAMVESVAYSPDGKSLASAAVDWTVRVWDAGSGRESHTFGMNTITGRCVAFSPDGRLVAGSDDCCAKLWDIAGASNVLSWQTKSKGVADLAFSPDGLQLATGGEDGSVKTWDSATGRCQHTVPGSGPAITRVAFTRDGKQQLIATADGNVTVVETATGNKVREWAGFSLVTFGPDGQRFAGLDRAGALKVMEVDRQVEAFAQPGPPQNFPVAWARALALGPNSTQLACGGDFAAVQLWEIGASRQPQNLQCCPPNTYRLNYAIFALAMDRAGRQLAVGTAGGVIQIWDLETARQLQTLRRHDNKVTHLVFSPDGKRLASVADDRTMRLWDTTSGLEVFSVRSASPLTCLAFNPTGDTLACADTEGTVQLRKARLPVKEPIQPKDGR
jgi:WD40 repeat protein